MLLALWRPVPVTKKASRRHLWSVAVCRLRTKKISAPSRNKSLEWPKTSQTALGHRERMFWSPLVLELRNLAAKISPTCIHSGMLQRTPSQSEVCTCVFFFITLSSITVSRKDYARCISADYHKLVDGKSVEEKDSNLKEVREWAASRESVGEEGLSLKSISTRVTSIREKFTTLVWNLVIYGDEHY